MIYNQNETERVLRQHLDATFNFRPEWGTQLLWLNQYETGIEDGHRLAAGSQEKIRTRLVIGADGLRRRVHASSGARRGGNGGVRTCKKRGSREYKIERTKQNK